jgi:hypothetical protein
MNSHQLDRAANDERIWADSFVVGSGVHRQVSGGHPGCPGAAIPAAAALLLPYLNDDR